MSYCDATVAAIYQSALGGELSDYIGWWYDGYEPGEEGGRADDYEVSLGDGFMGSFNSGYEIEFTSAGQVHTVATSFIANPDATETPVFANYLPRRIPLKYMTPVDGTSEYGSDLIQVINPTTQEADYLMSYCDATVAAIYQSALGGELSDYIGWWYDGYEPGEVDGRADGYPVEAGVAFMGSFNSGYEVEFQMPSALVTINNAEFVDPE